VGMNCPLCNNTSSTEIYKKKTLQTYHHCEICDLRFLNPAHHLSSANEKFHYLTHENNVEDLRYQNFVNPLIESILATCPSPDSIGLDFGCGPGPVVTYLLRQKGYSVHCWDPFFYLNHEVLEQPYNFVFCCESAEHFNWPSVEFEKLKSLLKPDGFLFIMTDIFFDSKKFENWHYHRDPTHVSFYSPNCFEWIKAKHSFKSVTIVGNRVVILRS
jgi:SAM-dependent methyltransferase